ncbi:MAG: hypothetical protein ABJH07_16945 [Sedimentitalea sp.]|uniref:hypothetical protein n=1 Tax=Sedimentitalea sp. TaxID=2048915 RepID=UPI003265EFA4
MRQPTGASFQKGKTDMDYEPVGNTTSVSTSTADLELADIDQEFAEVAEMFDLDESVAAGDLDELDAALEGTDLGTSGTESAGSHTLLDFADGVVGAENMPEWGWPFIGYLEKKAKRLVKILIAKFRKYRKYRKCLPTLLKAVAAIKARKWGTAIKQVYATYRCMKSA